MENGLAGAPSILQIARRRYRFAFRSLYFGSRHILSPHITSAWRRSREDSSRGWLLYAQVSARDPTTELAEPSQKRSAPRIGSGDHDYGNTERRVCQSERASEAAQSNSTLGRRMRSWHGSRDSRSLRGLAPIRRDKALSW